MSPKAADPSVRTALVEAAAQIIASDGAANLTLRRLADAVGTSTMAIYTHFGGMANLRQELRREGFARLRDHLNSVEVSGDPLVDVLLLGCAYYDNARENPNLYRVMFTEQHQPAEEIVGLDTFEQLVAGLTRCVEAGLVAPAQPVDLALQLWSALHGVVTLELAGLLAPDLAAEMMLASWHNLAVGFGADAEAIEAARRAAGRVSALAAPAPPARRQLGLPR